MLHYENHVCRAKRVQTSTGNHVCVQFNKRESVAVTEATLKTPGEATWDSHQETFLDRH